MQNSQLLLEEDEALIQEAVGEASQKVDTRPNIHQARKRSLYSRATLRNSARCSPMFIWPASSPAGTLPSKPARSI